ncbi:MAG TPA: HWE histidine kinase domain-containing protein [Roseiarcus sp.]|nr:HWE histidine kinase domain-containing protein [Roseiarcus sp.]
MTRMHPASSFSPWGELTDQPRLKPGRRDRPFEALLLASADVVFWANAAGELVESQPYWQDYTGQTWEEYRGSRWVACLHPDDREAVVADWKAAVASGGPYFSQGRVWSARHNAYRAFQTRAIAVRNSDGEVEEWLGALTDVQDTIDIKALLDSARDDLANSLRSLRLREAESRVRLAELQSAQNELAVELSDAKTLQQISAKLFPEQRPEALYENLLDAAMALMRSDAAALQMVGPEGSHLELLATRNFDPVSEAHWRRIEIGSSSACSRACVRIERTITEDAEASLVDAPKDLAAYRASGLRSSQATPLVSRSGRMLGILSTQWRKPHRPQERDFDLFDVVARQAADLIERAKAESRLREKEERLQVMVAELQHRTRNLIAIVLAIADRTARASETLDDFRSSFAGRLSALARVQGLLSRTPDGRQIAFDELLVSELSAQSAWPEDCGKVTLDGSKGVMLRSGLVQTLALALHELTTNAVKYGALKEKNGRLAVRWRAEVAPQDQTTWIHVDWKERGIETSHSNAKPGRIGSGRRLIENALPYQFGARTSFAIEADGVHCTIALPV